LLRVHQLARKGVTQKKRRNDFIDHTKYEIEYVHSKVTYLLSVHKFTQQVGKGCKRRNELSLIIQNPILSMHTQLY